MAHYPNVLLTSANSYRSYVATVVQSSTGAPYSEVLYNTLGYTPNWTRDSAGLYRLTAGEFDLENSNKIALFYNPAISIQASFVDSGLMPRAEMLWDQDFKQIIFRTGYMLSCSDTGCSDVFEFILSDNYTNTQGGSPWFKASLELRIYN